MRYRKRLEEMRRDFPDTWDYYNIHRTMPLETYFQEPIRFISRTFEHAQKMDLAPKIRRNDLSARSAISAARAAHSISALLLGAMLANRFCGGAYLNFQTDFTRATPNRAPYSFSYLWTMLSLYHDFGYCLEKDTNLAQKFSVPLQHRRQDMQMLSSRPSGKRVTSDLLNELGIHHTIWSSALRTGLARNAENNGQSRIALQHQLVCEYNKLPKYLYANNSPQPIVFPSRSRADIDGYALFRLTMPQDKTACIDHGVFGGYLLFDNFIKNYVNIYMEEKRQDQAADFHSFTHHQKRFHFDQLTVFAYLADCIMNHNIWRQEADKTGGKLCKELGLYRIIGTNYEKVNLQKNPLLFILALADSLEPYKLFCEGGIDSHDYDPAELWNVFDHTEFSVHGDTISIKAPAGKEDQLSKNLESMEKWMDLLIGPPHSGVANISPRIEKQTRT